MGTTSKVGSVARQRFECIGICIGICSGRIT